MTDSILLSDGTRERAQSPRGGIPALILFAVILAAYVVQSQLTQYVQMDLGFRQPYLLFWISHSSFILIFPIHLLYLVKSTGIPAMCYISGLCQAVSRHFDPNGPHHQLPWRKLAIQVLWLTAGVTTTAALWYISVMYAPVSDVTALFNTNAFWAYALSVWLNPSAKWEWRKLGAVIFACFGSFMVIYGGETVHGNVQRTSGNTKLSGSAFIGNTLAIISSLAYALYQILYKQYAALEDGDGEDSIRSASWGYAPILDAPSSSPLTLGSLLPSLSESAHHGAVSPPFAFHPNFITSLIGLATLLFFWFPLPVLYALGVGDPFSLPSDLRTCAYIAAVAISGLIFNGGFMVLLGIWGPVIVSVGNLLTIVLVLLSDAIFGHAASTVTSWSLFGSGMIIIAFAVLASDMMKPDTSRQSIPVHTTP